MGCCMSTQPGGAEKKKKGRGKATRLRAAADPNSASSMEVGTPSVPPTAAPAGPPSPQPGTEEVLCGLTLRQRQELAASTHFTLGEIEVLCKHYAAMSGYIVDDGVIDKSEWSEAFKGRDRVAAERSPADSSLRPLHASTLHTRIRSDDRAGGAKATVPASLLNESFLNLPNIFANRMFTLFDGDGNQEIDLEEFIRGLSVFSRHGTKPEKVKFAFRIYDIDADGYISREELRAVLLGALQEAHGKNTSSSVTMSVDRMNMMVDQTFQEADTNADNKIDFTEFEHMVESYPDIIANINFRHSLIEKTKSSG